MEKRSVDAKVKVLVQRPNGDFLIVDFPPRGAEVALSFAIATLYEDQSVELKRNGKVVLKDIRKGESLEQVATRLLKPCQRLERIHARRRATHV